MTRVGVFSAGILKIPHLNTLLEADVVRLGTFSRQDCDYIAGWGLKPSTGKARSFSHEQGIPFISLEDGFVRSLGLGVEATATHSMVVDSTGIYYDSTRPSDLEDLIFHHKFDEALLQRSKRCISLLKSYRLSKYNHAPDVPLKTLSELPKVLVVDQTLGDASVLYGNADQHSFVRMLDTAISEHPNAEICVKVHPDVIAGAKKGYLLNEAIQRDCTLIFEDISPWALFDAVEHVYVVTSQIGFEALIAGKKVSCFGLPFYAGWGLTNDFLQCKRRGACRSLEQVFAAAYLLYCLYINPYTGLRCELEDTINLINDQRCARERYSGEWLAVGFSRWKKSFISNFLGTRAKIKFIRGDVSKIKQVPPKSRVLAWASSSDPKFEALCSSKNINLWKMEDGFIRSAGLGLDRVNPMSLVVDASGIYYDPSKPSDLESLLNNTEISSELIKRAAEIRKRLVEARLSKYNVGNRSAIALPEGKITILVPGQVETDASIYKGSPSIKTNLQLLERVRKENPDKFIIYKPHPDVISGGRYGEVDQKRAALFYDLQLTDVSIADLLDQVDEVHTMTSLAGFEALLRGVKVVTYGLPFYAGWGLTEDKEYSSSRCRNLHLDELVAVTLILYPVYVDPVSGDQVNIETVIEILQRGKNESFINKVCMHFYRIFRNLFLKC